MGRTLLEGAGERKRERGGAYLLRSKLLCCEREIALFVYSGILFVRQIEVPRGEFICATNKTLRIHKLKNGHFVGNIRAFADLEPKSTIPHKSNTQTNTLEQKKHSHPSLCICVFVSRS